MVEFCAVWPNVPRIRVAFALERSLARMSEDGKLIAQPNMIDICKALKKQVQSLIINR